MSELWQHLEEGLESMSPETRLIVAMMKGQKAEIDEIRESVQLIERNASVFQQAMKEQADETKRISEQLALAMPGGDVDGHRRYHEEIIKRMEFRNEIIRDAIKRGGAWGIFGGSVWLFYAIWNYFLATIHK